MPSTCSCVLSLGDADLRRHVERNLAQVVAVGDAVDERDDEVEARLQHRVEAAEPLDDQRVLLRHDADRLHDDDERDDEERERDEDEPIHMVIVSSSSGDCRDGSGD